MFLTTKPQTIEDFLQAVNFIAPKGYNLIYFITPHNNVSDTNMQDNQGPQYSPPIESNYIPNSEPSVSIVPGITDTVMYTKKDFKDTHSFSQPNINLEEIPNAMPKTVENHVEKITTTPLTGLGGVIESPVKLDRRVDGQNVQDVQDRKS